MQENILKIKNSQIKIFTYMMNNEQISSLIEDKQIDSRQFLETVLVPLFNTFIRFLQNEEDIKLKFLLKNVLQKDELFLILRTFKNSIFFDVKNNSKLSSYDFTRRVDEVFDIFYLYLFKKSQTIKIVKDEDEINYLLNTLDENLAILYLDLDGRIENSSTFFRKLFLSNKKKIKFEKIENLIVHKSEATKFLEKLDNEDNFFIEAIEVLKCDESVFWVEINVEKRENDIIVIFKDISYKKSLENQKKVFLEQSKMAAMGELISMIAHQWRQPLQTVSILAQKLVLTKKTDGYVDNDILQKSVTDIDSQLDYMSKTIDDFRNFFKPESQKVITKPSKIIDKAVKFLHYILTINNIEFKLDIINDKEISIIENNLIQVIINIIKNAIDVLLEREIESKLIIIRCDFNENYVIIEIEDNAGGIPEEDLNKVFDSYFTTKHNDKGTGLGLYMSKTIIEEHSLGKLSVKNSSNGALFKIELPVE
ncbi:MAG: sensor histidine kinase [Arcobacter sp.]|uniref:sensor histidine kinase n=1 Tax=Arcobacter sp. TaxID=1872629 RepID=UPI003B00A1A6